MPTTLIDDALNSIFKYCGPSALAIVSQVSSGTHILALPHLVRRVDLKGARQASLFLAFLLQYPPGSTFCLRGIAHHIFELRLDFFVLHSREVFDDEDLAGDRDYPCSQLAPMLVRGMTDMANLRLLDIGSNTEGAMRYCPELARSLLVLPSLKSLTLSDVGVLASMALGKAAEALNNVSELQNLQLSPMLSSRHRLSQCSPFLNQFLLYLSPSVVNLEISDFDLSRLVSEVNGPEVVFPNVLRLGISPYGSALQEISNAFPNITALTLERGNLNLRPQSPDHLFPRLIYLTAHFDDIAAILRSQATTGQQREIRCLDFISESDALPDIQIDGLKSLYFRQHPVRPGTWWQELAKTLSDLVVLRLFLTADSLQDLDLIGGQLPPLFSSVPLQCITLFLWENEGITKGLDTADVARDIALSWAKKVPTLKHVILKLDFGLYGTLSPAYAYGWEVVRDEGETVELRAIPYDEASDIEDDLYHVSVLEQGKQRHHNRKWGRQSSNPCAVRPSALPITLPAGVWNLMSQE
ncbi:hypothetical protein BKA70DRAFT_1281029 [Coprinopsis sp. MPI-PUGE-AT-0042]|nr:hypothetical protein BKA70DRAFT_1281029 [Coprinopsis sp. MPI-PUGE-AT-0042]